LTGICQLSFGKGGSFVITREIAVFISEG